jgi:hypothetical protein
MTFSVKANCKMGLKWGVQASRSKRMKNERVVYNAKLFHRCRGGLDHKLLSI